MIEQCQIREYMQVRGWDGQPVGKVDKLEGGHIRLINGTGNGSARHQPQYIELAAIWSVDGNVLCLDRTAEEASASFNSARAKTAEAGLSTCNQQCSPN